MKMFIYSINVNLNIFNCNGLFLYAQFFILIHRKCLILAKESSSILLAKSVSAAQTRRGQASSVPAGPTAPLPYMYTWSGYVNFDMWVSISPIFTIGFIRP